MDLQRKRLLFRARHMGTNENDIFFGQFAEAALASMSASQLDRFERLLEANDPDLFAWVTGGKPIPAEHDHDVMRMLHDFTVEQARR